MTSKASNIPEPGPSKVLHIRNVVPEITQEDLQAFCAAFGIVKSVVIMRSKNQALVQMDDISSAINLVMAYKTVQARIKGRNVYPRFSNHQELTGQPQGEATSNRIILVTIHNPTFKITVDVMLQIFQPYGTIEKIVIFSKSAGTS
mmetsp:Transcript_19865/g.32586  ORF Transcript_19865/g.32586 Transcript_19865/m.32586 type:complete len:146 (-) Transcript_19865:121-558(-)